MEIAWPEGKQGIIRTGGTEGRCERWRDKPGLRSQAEVEATILVQNLAFRVRGLAVNGGSVGQRGFGDADRRTA